MVNSKSKGEIAKREEWLLISELAEMTKYKKGYLSLMARQGKLKARKHNKNWYSTAGNLKIFETEKNESRALRNNHLRKLYQEKAATVKTAVSTKKSPVIKKVKLRTDQDTIFDEVQKELEEVLTEIREKQRKLKRGFAAYREPASSIPANVLEKERKETEDLSEKLIMDLGRLINTANEVQEGKKKGKVEEAESDYEISSDDMFSIPVKRISKETKGGVSGKSIDLDRRNIVSKVDNSDIDNSKIAPIEKDNFLNESYNYFPFEREERPEEGSDATSKILTAVIVLLLLVAAGLIFLILWP